MSRKFADLLREYRDDVGLTKKRLAELVGVDRGRIAAWESGTCVPRDYAVVQDLTEQLDLSLPKRKLFEDAYTAARKHGKGDTENELFSIEARLLARLESVKDACKARQTRFLTPHLFLVLLELPDSLMYWALNRVWAYHTRSDAIDFAARIRDGLRAYIANDLPRLSKDPFQPFAWNDRPDIGLAKTHAFSTGTTIIGERHLVLGVLEAHSATINDLHKLLGDKYEVLIDIVKTAKGPPWEQGTPGRVLDIDIL